MRRAAVLAGAGLLLAVTAPTPSNAAPASRAAVAASACPRAQFRVVLDVGHTTEFPGAFSARGVPEHDFNLSLGRRMEQALLAAGFARTVLLATEGPPMESLNERVRRANRLSADLLLSIHHDSVPDAFLQVWQYDGSERPYSDRFKGHSIFISNDNRDRPGSLQFARLLGLQMKARDLRYTPHYTRSEMGRRRRVLMDKTAGVYRYDQLIVLRATRMPAVLLEAASIINRDEELAAASPERQGLVAEAVAQAVEQFCAARAQSEVARPKRPLQLHAAQPRGAAMPARGASRAPLP